MARARNQANERLTLSMLMRAPGSGLQVFSIRERGNWRVVELCADWHLAGYGELSYWYAQLPLYTPLMHSAVAAVARRAEALDEAWAAAAEQVVSATSRDRRNGLRQLRSPAPA